MYSIKSGADGDRHYRQAHDKTNKENKKWICNHTVGAKCSMEFETQPQLTKHKRASGHSKKSNPKV